MLGELTGGVITCDHGVDDDDDDDDDDAHLACLCIYACLHRTHNNAHQGIGVLHGCHSDCRHGDCSCHGDGLCVTHDGPVAWH